MTGLVSEAVADFAEGIALVKAQRPADALASLDRALAAAPDLNEVRAWRGLALQALGRRVEAIAAYRSALEINPSHVGCLRNLAGLLADQGCREEAIAICDAAIGFHPDDASLHMLRGAQLAALWRGDEAVLSLEAAIRLNPVYPKALALLGLAHRQRLDLPAAISAFRAADALDSNNHRLQAHFATALLAAGEFEEGWRIYEARQTCPPPAGRLWKDGWRGERPVGGLDILVVAEQGLGDTIQFCRYLPMLEDQGARVLFAPQSPLKTLMKSLGASVEIVDAAKGALKSNLHCRLLSLPLAFGARLQTIPANVPYLRVDPDRVDRWRTQLGAGGFKVGVCWRGSLGGGDQGRAFSVAWLKDLAAIDRVRLISLQAGARDTSYDEVPPGMRLETLEGLDREAAFVDTAAVMESCDLVITCDTSVAHLAGALNRPAWIALPFQADWRWLTARTDTPWYPKTTLFRQSSRGDWSLVFTQMAARLAALV